jgi:hypothetical protein
VRVGSSDWFGSFHDQRKSEMVTCLWAIEIFTPAMLFGFDGQREIQNLRPVGSMTSSDLIESMNLNVVFVK